MGEQHKYNKKLISGEISRVLVRAIKHASKQDNQYNVISITGSPFYLLQTWKYKYDARQQRASHLWSLKKKKKKKDVSYNDTIVGVI